VGKVGNSRRFTMYYLSRRPEYAIPY
jgi:hypothetical protein